MKSIAYNFEADYLDMIGWIASDGEHRLDRTGVGTKAMFGLTMNIHLQDGFPLLTTKRVPFKSVVSELLWFIEGSQDERRLAEILHGTRDPEKKTIWTANAEAEYWKGGNYPGDLGRVYGVQWRDWRTVKLTGYGDFLSHDKNTTSYFDAKVQVTKTDQLADLIHGLKTKPTDRRHILTAWNPGELSQMALPPCHMFAQFYLSNDNKLSCQMYQRSVDTFLGLPFNIASYALLTHLIAHCIGAGVDRLFMVLGDTHVYCNHLDAVKEQLTREQRPLPTLKIAADHQDIDSFTMDQIVLEGYDPHGTIKAEMAV
jgi:thymidylate synthase